MKLQGSCTRNRKTKNSRPFHVTWQRDVGRILQYTQPGCGRKCRSKAGCWESTASHTNLRESHSRRPRRAPWRPAAAGDSRLVSVSEGRRPADGGETQFGHETPVSVGETRVTLLIYFHWRHRFRVPRVSADRLQGGSTDTVWMEETSHTVLLPSVDNWAFLPRELIINTSCVSQMDLTSQRSWVASCNCSIKVDQEWTVLPFVPGAVRISGQYIIYIYI